MKLLTKDLMYKLPPLGAMDGKDPKKVKVMTKFFCPWNQWTWFCVEGSPEGIDFRFFGYVKGLENELGYFCLSELESNTGPVGLKIERDRFWNDQTTLSQVMEGTVS